MLDMPSWGSIPFDGIQAADHFLATTTVQSQPGLRPLIGRFTQIGVKDAGEQLVQPHPADALPLGQGQSLAV